MTRASAYETDTIGLWGQSHAPFVAVMAIRFAVCVTKWATYRRTRAALAKLEPWQLADVGLTPDQAATEAARAFWKL